MTDDERAALVEQMFLDRIKVIGEGEYTMFGVPAELMTEITRLLAAHDLDALPFAWTLHEAYRDAVGFYAYVEQDSACEGYEGWFGGGRGATLNAAIRNAVEQAQGRGEGDE